MTLEARKSWSGMSGTWSSVTKMPGSLSLCRRYLEVNVPFRRRVRFSPGLVAVSAGWVIPYLWSTVTVRHDLEDYPNPIVFRPCWPCSIAPIMKALDQWGYTTPMRPDESANPNEYDRQAGRVGRVSTPLTPYGKIDIDGRTFSALAVSGELRSGLVEVIRNGETSLLVKEKRSRQPPDMARYEN